MNITTRHALRRSLVVFAFTALLAGCAEEAPLGPNSPGELSLSQGVDLTGCEHLAAPEGSKLAHQLYAEGVQIYRWDGASWVFVAPRAVLYPNARSNGIVGTHYAGPTWESNGGSKVVAAVAERCPRAGTIPWLLLRAVSAEGPGIFRRTTFIQRVSTTGGTAPSAPGAFVGEIAEVPYTAEYLFYNAH